MTFPDLVDTGSSDLALCLFGGDSPKAMGRGVTPARHSLRINLAPADFRALSDKRLSQLRRFGLELLLKLTHHRAQPIVRRLELAHLVAVVDPAPAR